MDSTANNLPRVAIVVPVYNVAPYVVECLESISKQTYRNWKCIVVDDGSTDGSGEIVDLFSKQDHRFKVIHKVNGGLSSARNVGLEEIENDGQYDLIGFVDSDDRIEENMYSLLVEALEDDDVDVAVCGCYKFDSNYKKSRPFKGSDSLIDVDEYVSLVMSNGKWARSDLAGGMVVKNLFKATILEDLRFLEEDIIEDELFSIQAATRFSKARIVNQALYGYRQRQDSLVRNDRFFTRHVKCRKLCINEAIKISEYARLVTVTAYISSLINIFKQYEQPPELLRAFDMDLNRSLEIGIVDKKLYLYYLLFAHHSLLTKIYRKMRRFLKR